MEEMERVLHLAINKVGEAGYGVQPLIMSNLMARARFAPTYSFLITLKECKGEQVPVPHVSPNENIRLFSRDTPTQFQSFPGNPLTDEMMQRMGKPE